MSPWSQKGGYATLVASALQRKGKDRTVQYLYMRSISNVAKYLDFAKTVMMSHPTLKSLFFPKNHLNQCHLRH